MFKKKRSWIILLVIIVIAGGGYYIYQNYFKSADAADEPALQTTTARRGEIVLYASGAGTVIPGAELGLSNATAGELISLTAEVGLKVQAGDELARIDDTSARQAVASAEIKVRQAELNLASAQLALEDVLAGSSDADILNAQASLKSAQENLAEVQAGPTDAELAAAQATQATAQENYDSAVNGPTARELEDAQLSLDKAKNSLWSSQASRDTAWGRADASQASKDSATANVLNAEISVRQAEMKLEELQEPATATELADLKAKVLQAEEKLADLMGQPTEVEIANAEAQVAKAQQTLDDLLDNPTDEDMAQAQSTVEQRELDLPQARESLLSAQEDLEETVLTAPIAGTITDVSADVGEYLAANKVFITLMDTENFEIETYLDETDLDQIGVGYEVEVILDALPDETFVGHVTRISPELYNVSGASAVKAWVELDDSSFAKPQGLLMGMNAAVDVIGGRAENAVIIPVEALRELGTGKYAVFVVVDGELELRMVEVGLMDYASVEIVSGLEAGETISTGIVETD